MSLTSFTTENRSTMAPNTVGINPVSAETPGIHIPYSLIPMNIHTHDMIISITEITILSMEYPISKMPLHFGQRHYVFKTYQRAPAFFAVSRSIFSFSR